MERERSYSHFEEPPYFSNVEEEVAEDCPCGKYPYGDCEKCNSPEAAILRQREQLAEQSKNPVITPKSNDFPITDYLPYRRLKNKLNNKEGKNDQEKAA